MSHSSVEVVCPHCLSRHDSDKLETLTEYGCWSSEDCSVHCPDCGKSFDVACSQAGYYATDSFDINTFMKTNKVEVPAHINHHIVRSYLAERAYNGDMERMTSLKPSEQAEWDAAYEFAQEVWKNVKGKNVKGKT